MQTLKLICFQSKSQAFQLSQSKKNRGVDFCSLNFMSKLLCRRQQGLHSYTIVLIRSTKEVATRWKLASIPQPSSTNFFSTLSVVLKEKMGSVLEEKSTNKEHTRNVPNCFQKNFFFMQVFGLLI